MTLRYRGIAGHRFSRIIRGLFQTPLQHGYSPQCLVDAGRKGLTRSANTFGSDRSHAAQKKSIIEPLIGGVNQIGAHISSVPREKNAAERKVAVAGRGLGLETDASHLTPSQDSILVSRESQRSVWAMCGDRNLLKSKTSPPSLGNRLERWESEDDRQNRVLETYSPSGCSSKFLCGRGLTRAAAA
jgi:hypothetical protein